MRSLNALGGTVTDPECGTVGQRQIIFAAMIVDCLPLFVMVTWHVKVADNGDYSTELVKLEWVWIL